MSEELKSFEVRINFNENETFLFKMPSVIDADFLPSLCERFIKIFKLYGKDPITQLVKKPISHNILKTNKSVYKVFNEDRGLTLRLLAYYKTDKNKFNELFKTVTQKELPPSIAGVIFNFKQRHKITPEEIKKAIEHLSITEGVQQ